MNDNTPFFPDAALSPKSKPSLRVAFDIDQDTLHTMQNALDGTARFGSNVADYIDLLKFMATSTEFDSTDPRLMAAFDIGARAVRSFVDTEGSALFGLLDRIDDPQSVSGMQSSN